MKKLDYKKLALLGIAGGVLISAQASAEPSEENTNITSETLLAGRSSNQGHYHSRDGYYNDGYNQDGVYYQNSGCGGRPAPAQGGTVYQPQQGSGCGGRPAPVNVQVQPRQGGSGCGGRPAGSVNVQPRQGGSGCGGRPQNYNNAPQQVQNQPQQGYLSAAGCGNSCKGGNGGGRPNPAPNGTPPQDEQAMVQKRANLQHGQSQSGERPAGR